MGLDNCSMTPSHTKLFQLINDTNYPLIPLSADNVTLENPLPAVGAGYNTRVSVVAIPNQGYTRSATVFYRRTNLAALGTELAFTIGEHATPEALVQAINTARRAWVALEDLEEFVLPATEEDHFVELVAKASSVGWFGTLTVAFKAP